MTEGEKLMKESSDLTPPGITLLRQRIFSRAFEVMR
jgi:hypothetical protein